MHYKQFIYESYRTSFKGECSHDDLVFGARKLLPVIEPFVKKSERTCKVLDLGCGAGELLFAFQQLGFTDLNGCDLSPQQVALARRFFPNVSGENLFDCLSRLPSASVGIITAFDVIEHLGPQATFDLFKELRRVLRPDGIFIAHLPNGNSPFVGSVYWGDMTHEWCLTPNSAKSLCLLHGFSNFIAAEHLGTSNTLQGKMRAVGWRFVRLLYNCLNVVETGAKCDVWTRNFVFACQNATSKET